MEIKKIEKVEPKPEVNIFLKKPFVADTTKDNQQMEDQGFQKLLDNSIDELRKNNKSFNQQMNSIIEDAYETPEEEHTLTTREIQILELKRTRRDFDRINGYDERGPRLKH